MSQQHFGGFSNTIASLSVNGVLALYDASNGKTIKSYAIQGIALGGESVQPAQLLWSPNSQYLALDNGEPELQVWNIKNDYTASESTNLSTPRAMLWLPNAQQISLIDASGTQNIISVDGL